MGKMAESLCCTSPLALLAGMECARLFQIWSSFAAMSQCLHGGHVRNSQKLLIGSSLWYLLETLSGVLEEKVLSIF
ncbi:hypothetical protein A7N05_18995 [Acinetobacter baumannii]|nr:hypothetical protein A7N05_18995 [Acinetobacter baumannii]